MERFFEDFQVGEERRTGGRTITEADIVFHAYHTGDYYPHHMDAEWSRQTEFGQRVAHGTLVFAVAIGMTATGEVNTAAFSYGYDRLRFVRPVFIGDTIGVRVRVTDKREHQRRADHGIVVEACEVTNQRGETVLACEHLLMARRRPAAAAAPP